MINSKTSIFSKIWKYGKRGCTQRERYLDLPSGIRVASDCICAQICAFKDTKEVMVYVLYNPESPSDNYGEFEYLHDLPMKCVKCIITFIEGLGVAKTGYNPLADLDALAELKRKLEED